MFILDRVQRGFNNEFDNLIKSGNNLPRAPLDLKIKLKEGW